MTIPAVPLPQVLKSIDHVVRIISRESVVAGFQADDEHEAELTAYYLALMLEYAAYDI